MARIATARQLSIPIGCHALWHVATSVKVEVVIVDTRQRWNIADCLIEPVAGAGAKWVEVGSLSPMPSNGNALTVR